jgi:cytochrome c-type biogenesis protein CcmE
MNPLRRQRLFLVLFVVLGATAAVGMTLAALQENLNAFYPPAQIVDGSAPEGVRIRAGGMVKEGSVQRATEGLQVSFVLTDHAGSEFTVVYEGILPDLFREGQGIMTTGQLASNGRFEAQEVLAKHDENYHPPELAGIPKAAPGAGDAKATGGVGYAPGTYPAGADAAGAYSQGTTRMGTESTPRAASAAGTPSENYTP